MVFNEMLRETDFLRMTAFAMGVSTLDYNRTAATLNTNGLLFKLYGELLGAGSIPVALAGNSPQPAPMQHIVGDLPRTSAGSPTYPLDMVAALSADHKFLTLAVVNATDSEEEVQCRGRRRTPDRHRNTIWQMTSKELEAANHVGQSPQVEVKGNRNRAKCPALCPGRCSSRAWISIAFPLCGPQDSVRFECPLRRNDGRTPSPPANSCVPECKLVSLRAGWSPAARTQRNAKVIVNFRLKYSMAMRSCHFWGPANVCHGLTVRGLTTRSVGQSA